MDVVIVEDEKLSAEHLALLLQKINPNTTIVAYFDTVKATVEGFKKGLKADLVFLDIHLADGNSFDIFQQINLELPIIFTTAYDQYALQAFKHNSIDYLLKPISSTDLEAALKKLNRNQFLEQQKLLLELASNYEQLNKSYKLRFLVKLGQTIEAVPTDQIHHFETQDSLSFIVTTKGNRYPIDYSLDQLETLIHPNHFFRINRKVILHFQSILKTNTYFNGRLVVSAKYLENEAKIISRERVNDFKNWLDQ